MSIPELSLNQATTRPYQLAPTVEAAARRGLRWIGLWTGPVEEIGAASARRLLDDAGMAASSLCRVGFVADKTGLEFVAAMDETRRALETAHIVGAPQLTFIAGALPAEDRRIAAAEERVRDALVELVPEARAAGVRLALEPLHPLFVTSRSAITTLAQALRVIDGLPRDAVGVLVDAYATCWDPDLRESLRAAGDRIAGVQVSDFALPLPFPDNMNGRMLPGDGELDLAGFVRDTVDAGWSGPVEVEVFSDAVWALPLDTIVQRMIDGAARALAAAVADPQEHLA